MWDCSSCCVCQNTFVLALIQLSAFDAFSFVMLSCRNNKEAVRLHSVSSRVFFCNVTQVI